MSMNWSVRAMLFSTMFLLLSAASFAQVRVAITIAPPPLPIYEQPLCPGDGYLWTPGYWAYDYDDTDYYWVPGTWVLPPDVGFLWTPPYWGWEGGAFVFYDGYWGPEVGFYGGIPYGFGYFGVGFEGGRWEGGRFFYNRAVTNVNVTNIRNVYEANVTNVNVVNRVSYNGGNGGINARPTPQEEAAVRARHLPPVEAQREHIKAARNDRQLRASANQGRPPIAATLKPGAFKDYPVAAREAGGPYNPRANTPAAAAGGENNARPGRPENNARQAIHPKDLPPMERPAPPNTGNAKLDQKYQQQQEKMMAQQDKERQKLEQKQEKEHQQLEKQKADDARRHQVEQRHQQQTAQMQQRQEQKMQRMEEKHQPPMHSQTRPPKPPQS